MISVGNSANDWVISR